MFATLRRYAWVWVATAAWALAPSASRAGTIAYTVTFSDTTSLESQPGRGPYYLDFQLSDGSGSGDGNNTAIVSHLTLGGGALLGAPTLSGGATGDLSSAATLTDSGFFNDFNQQFAPGSSLSFQLSLTQNVGPGEDPTLGGTPDEFTFAIQYGTGPTDVPTTNFNDAFVTIDVTSPTLTVTSVGSDTTSGFAVPAASVAVPEPAALWLFALSVGGLGVRRWRRARVG